MLKEEQKEIKSIKNNKQKEKYYRHLISERKTDFFCYILLLNSYIL